MWDWKRGGIGSEKKSVQHGVDAGGKRRPGRNGLRRKVFFERPRPPTEKS